MDGRKFCEWMRDSTEDAGMDGRKSMKFQIFGGHQKTDIFLVILRDGDDADVGTVVAYILNYLIHVFFAEGEMVSFSVLHANILRNFQEGLLCKEKALR